MPQNLNVNKFPGNNDAAGWGNPALRGTNCEVTGDKVSTVSPPGRVLVVAVQELHDSYLAGMKGILAYKPHASHLLKITLWT